MHVIKNAPADFYIGKYQSCYICKSDKHFWVFDFSIVLLCSIPVITSSVVAEDPSEGEVVKYEGQNGTAEATRPVASPLKAAPQLTAVDVLRTPPKRATGHCLGLFC